MSSENNSRCLSTFIKQKLYDYPAPDGSTSYMSQTILSEAYHCLCD